MASTVKQLEAQIVALKAQIAAIPVPVAQQADLDAIGAALTDLQSAVATLVATVTPPAV